MDFSLSRHTNSHLDEDMHVNVTQMMRMGRELLDGRLSNVAVMLYRCIAELLYNVHTFHVSRSNVQLLKCGCFTIKQLLSGRRPMNLRTQYLAKLLYYDITHFYFFCKLSSFFSQFKGRDVLLKNQINRNKVSVSPLLEEGIIAGTLKTQKMYSLRMFYIICHKNLVEIS